MMEPDSNEAALLDTVEDLAVTLVKRLVERGAAEEVEAAIVAVLDPVYERLSRADPMMRLLFLCDRIRAITGLPILPGVGD